MNEDDPSVKLAARIPHRSEEELEDIAYGIRFANSIIKVMVQFQPMSGSSAPFFEAMLGAVMGALIGLVGKEYTVAMLERITQAARTANVSAAPTDKRGLH